MKVVLVRPPFYALFGLTTPKMKTYPLNLLSLATYVRERSGHDVALVDGENVSVPGLEPVGGPDRDPEQVMHRGIPRMVEILANPEHALWQELDNRILSSQPDLVGITCNSGNMDTARIMVRRLKKQGLPVILGGSHPTVLPEQSLNYTSADFAAVGEGELTMVHVLDALEGRDSLAQIPSLAWTDHGRVELNARGPLIRDLNELPIPDRSFIDRSDYFGEVIMTGRGCPFKCGYCASRTIWGRTVRFRSVESIVEELTILKNGAEKDSGESASSAQPLAERPVSWAVKVLDDTFTINRQRTLELLDQIVARGLNCFEFTGGVRADTLNEALVHKMRDANFRRVTLGVESGSPRILDMIHKGETNEDVKRAVKLLRQAGIHSHAFFMIGFPGETKEDVELSKKLIMEAQPDHVEINMVTPYPGTELFEKLIREDPANIDSWHRWFHQGMSTHSELLGYNLDEAYEEFLEFARQYHASRNKA